MHSRSATLSSKNGNPIRGLPKSRPTSRLSQIQLSHRGKTISKDDFDKSISKNGKKKTPQKARSEGMQHPQTLQVCLMFSINSENTCICIWKWSLFNKASILKSLVSSWLVSDHCCYPHVETTLPVDCIHVISSQPEQIKKCWFLRETPHDDELILLTSHSAGYVFINYTNKSNSFFLGILNCSPWPCFIPPKNHWKMACHLKMGLSTQLAGHNFHKDLKGPGPSFRDLILENLRDYIRYISSPPFQPLLQPSGCWSLGQLNVCSSVNAMLKPILWGFWQWEDSPLLGTSNLQQIVG